MKDLEVTFVNRFKADTFERWLEARPKFEFERVELDDGSFVFLVFEVSELEEEEIRRESGGRSLSRAHSCRPFLGSSRFISETCAR
jgi:hypothetical protein